MKKRFLGNFFPLTVKKVIIIVVVIILAAAGATGYGLYILNQNKAAETTGGKRVTRVCSEDILKKASAAIEESDVNQLLSIKSDILKTGGYDADQNCLYVLVRLATLQNNANDAQKYLDLLKKSYVAGSYSTAFKTPGENPEQIQSTVDFIKMRNASVDEQIRKNNDYNVRMNEAADKSGPDGAE